MIQNQFHNYCDLSNSKYINLNFINIYNHFVTLNDKIIHEQYSLRVPLLRYIYTKLISNVASTDTVGLRTPLAPGIILQLFCTFYPQQEFAVGYCYHFWKTCPPGWRPTLVVRP